MSYNNQIYELTQLLGNRRSLENDMYHALSNAASVFQDKYISKIHSTVEKHNIDSRNNPCKEVVLLKTLKLFANPTVHSDLDRAVELMTMMDAARNMSSELKSLKAPYASNNNRNNFFAMSNSVHEDGVYDLDESCMINGYKNNDSYDRSANITGMILIMALVGII